MSLLFADGFDHYGSSTTGRANMLLGVYAEVASAWTPESTLPRNGTYSMRSNTATSNGFRRGLGAAKTTAGIAGAFYVTSLPTANTQCGLITMLDSANAAQICVRVKTTGDIEVVLGSLTTGTSLGTTTDQPFTAGTWHHVEVEWVASSTTSATDGTVTVNVDNVEVLAITGVDNVATSNREVSQVTYGLCSGFTGIPLYVDDIFGWDSAGSVNNDFLGDKDVLTYGYDEDGSDNAWIRSTSGTTSGNAYAEVDDAAQDGDSTYIEAQSAADIQTLEVEAVPSSVTGISGIVLVNMIRKTAAGASTVEVSIVESGGTASTAASISPTQSYVYYETVVELNPAAGTPAWTYTTLSAAKLKLNRTV